MNKVKVFQDELLLIANKDIRNFTMECINIIPNYFFEIPASSTGKYHPSFTLGKGGLIRHVKSTIQIAISLFQNSTICKFSQDEMDVIIASLILHDGCKNGLTGSKWTAKDHPLVMFNHIQAHTYIKLEEPYYSTILNCILKHMGQWGGTKNNPLPLPQSSIEIFVHLCDYLSSRKYITFKFY